MAPKSTHPRANRKHTIPTKTKKKKGNVNIMKRQVGIIFMCRFEKLSKQHAIDGL